MTFHYPNTERAALRHFSLEIPAGQTVAIVGPNGAGKSTLIKLLCRFYDVTDGSVRIDGVDVREFDPEELRRNITVLFQNFMRYDMTCAENVRSGNLAAVKSDESIREASRAAGAHDFITGLPHGYNTLLGKWFENGTELSGGEWQRVALARAYLRQAPIMLLDEPTSAMDSWAETDWMERFIALARGRTVVVITHRFTTARRADLIYVMDGGVIVEMGTHEQLLVRQGQYASSWHQQSSPQRQEHP